MLRREKRFKEHLLEIMGSTWDVQSHEDKYSEGIPDLSFGIAGINGWIELKQIKDWPVHAETKVRPEKYTAQQVNWLVKRGKKADNCYVMIKVGSDEYFVFGWQDARKIRQGMTRVEFFNSSLWYWNGGIIKNELVTLLSRTDL